MSSVTHIAVARARRALANAPAWNPDDGPSHSHRLPTVEGLAQLLADGLSFLLEHKVRK